MATKRRPDDVREALIRKAAADIKKLNPHIGEAQRPTSDDEYVRLCEDATELERVWDEMDRQTDGGAPRYLASDAVDEDRGD